MRIALVFPPFHHRRFSENLKVIDEEFVLAPPIILAYVAGILEKAGHDVILVDAHTLKLTKDEVVKRLNVFSPDMLAFRVETYNFQETLGWLQYLKSATGLPVLAGGINMSLYPQETMTHKEIDFGIIGEAVESLPAFLYAFENSRPYDDVPGLCWRGDTGKIHMNPPATELADFDSYPFPARHLLPNEKYHSFVSQRKNFTVMLTSTGCPYKCSFCAIAGLNHYRERSWESVIREIEECYYDYGIREIDFFDATFFINKPRCIKLFQEIRKRKLDISWTCRTRVDVVDEEILKEASLAGCRMIFWGIESNSQEVLDGIKKEIKVDQISHAIKTAKGLGIRNLGFLMVGNPGDSKKTIGNTLEFAKNSVDYVQICRTIAKPGSELNKRLIKETGYDYWREFILCKVDEQRLPAPWIGMSQEGMEKLLKWAYYSFYFRPKFIMATILKTRSVKELMRYVKVGTRMLFHYFYTDVAVAKDSKLIKKLAHWELDTAKLSQKAAIVIPAYNERENILKLLKKIVALYPSMEIFVVDSSSVDGTGDAVRKFSIMYPQTHLIKGKKYVKGNERGLAVKEGFHCALSRGAQVVIEMDADLSHDPEYIQQFLNRIGEFDIVIGSRYISGGAQVGRNVLRKIISRVSNSYVRSKLGMRGITDCTSGYRCYRGDAIRVIGMNSIKSTEGTSALIEATCKALRQGLKIKEIPITYVERKYDKSKFSFDVILKSLRAVSELRDKA